MLWLADYLPVNIPIGVRHLGLYSVAWRPIFLNWWNQLKRWIPKMEFLHGKCGASGPWYSHLRPVGSCSLASQNRHGGAKRQFLWKPELKWYWGFEDQRQHPELFRSPVKVRTLLFSTENMTAKALECFFCRCNRSMCTKYTRSLLVNLSVLIILPATLQHPSLP